MKNFNTNTNNHDEWLTPPEIIRALGGFDLHILHPEDGQNSLIAMEAIKFVEVDELSTTARGCQGYGSTGR